MAQNKHSLSLNGVSSQRHPSVASSASTVTSRRQSVYLGQEDAANTITAANQRRYAEYLAKSFNIGVGMVQPAAWGFDQPINVFFIFCVIAVIGSLFVPASHPERYSLFSVQLWSLIMDNWMWSHGKVLPEWDTCRCCLWTSRDIKKTVNSFNELGYHDDLVDGGSGYNTYIIFSPTAILIPTCIFLPWYTSLIPLLFAGLSALYHQPIQLIELTYDWLSLEND